MVLKITKIPFFYQYKANKMAKLFQLKCPDFQSNLAKKFRELKENTIFNDVTLVCDDEQRFSANKIVLISSSEYFYNILSNNKDVPTVLCLDGINCEELNLILDYVYLGEVEIELENIDRFRIIAEKFRLHGFYNVKNKMQEKMENKISHSDITDSYKPPKKVANHTNMDFTNTAQSIKKETNFQYDIHENESFQNFPHQQNNPNSDISNLLKEAPKNLRTGSNSSRITVMNEELLVELQEIQFTRRDEDEPNIYSCNNCDKYFDAYFLAVKHYQHEHQNLDVEREILMGLFEFRKKMKKYLKEVSKKQIDIDFQQLSAEFTNKLSELKNINEKKLNWTLKEKYNEIKQYLESKVNTPNYP